jgi:hypothetical protein
MVTTFLIDPDFTTSAKLLDYRRLGKQRLEAKQIVNILENYYEWDLINDNGNLKLVSRVKKQGFNKHTAVMMWWGYVDALKHYYNIIVTEWVRRGYKNTMQLYDVNLEKIVYPPWLKWNALYYSHRARLCEKNPNFYSFLKGSYPEQYDKYNYTYLWPTKVKPEICEKLDRNEIIPVDEMYSSIE